MLYTDYIDSPVGLLTLVADEQHLVVLSFGKLNQRGIAALQQRFGDYQLVTSANPHGFSAAIRRYFAGDLTAIDTIPVKLDGKPFQNQVWLALRTIPVGTTRSYGDLAAQLGNRSASRAVGYANSQNPIAIVLPCHRVIGANNDLTGYGGGLDRKRWLLRHEGIDLGGEQMAFDL
ncbi:MAG: methylated-DNA--[protein]-cysteine S-methyltransferase [Anaerolineae bacterium]|nr:methylated-DNA--[protein]-cysteine S-methyltransferase [Anaerolineae bacterium]